MEGARGTRRVPSPTERAGTMFVFFAVIAALGVAAMAGSVVVVTRDGYRRVPTRSYVLLP